MSSAGDPFSILNKNNYNRFQAPKPKPKVLRHKKGQRPDNEGEEEDEFEEPNEISHYTYGSQRDDMSVAGSEVSADPELAQKLARRRNIHRTVIVEESRKEEKPEPKERDEPPKPEKTVEKSNAEEEVVSRRRAKLKEKILEKEEVDNDDIFLQKIDEEDELKEPVDETDEQESQAVPLLKPVFLSKKERETRDVTVEEEIALKEEERRLKERKRQEAKALLIEVKKQNEKEEEEKDEENGELPDDDDTIDEANEYELWKIRELKRIKRDREERFKIEKEKKEIERRRKLTDAERNYENKMLGCDAIKTEKQKYKFMQKYYHKGAFYQDSDDPIFKRDYNVAVGDDLWDKSNLPKILQTRRGDWGKSSRSKYTHLTDQDTTNFDPQWRVSEEILNKNLTKLAGYKGSAVLDRPGKKK